MAAASIRETELVSGVIGVILVEILHLVFTRVGLSLKASRLLSLKGRKTRRGLLIRAVLRFVVHLLERLDFVFISLIILFPSIIVIAADLSYYEAFVALAGITSLIFKLGVVPFEIGDNTLESLPETPCSTSSKQLLKAPRSSRISVILACAPIVAAVSYLRAEGLSVLNPPNQLTDEVLNAAEHTFHFRWDAYTWKLILLVVPTMYKFVFKKKRWQSLLTFADCSVTALVWYLFKAETTPQNAQFLLYLATEKWTGRHLLFLLLLAATILHHSLTLRRPVEFNLSDVFEKRLQEHSTRRDNGGDVETGAADPESGAPESELEVKISSST